MYIVPDHVLIALDEVGVRYQNLAEDSLPTALTDVSFGYYRALKTRHPDLVDPSKTELPKPGEIFVLFYCDRERREETLGVLEGLGYRNGRMQVGIPVHVGSDADLEKKLELSGFLPEINYDQLVEELSKREIAGFSRETMILRKP